MIMNAAIYDTGAKTFLGTTVAANSTQADSIKGVIDAVFNASSTAPYVSKFLIQQLVLSNPSAAYVGRVSAVFANNGSGVRGDMKAVIRAILTDAEARGATSAAANPGKVKEPALMSLAVARLIGDRTDGYAFTTRDGAMGEQPFRAPSVFNFYPPDYPLPLGGNLLSPPSKLMTTATIIARHNLAYDWTVNGDVGSRSEYAVQPTITGATGTTPGWSAWEAFGTNSDAMIDQINLLMLANTMTAAQRAALLSAVNAVTNADATTQARKRAQVALYIVPHPPSSRAIDERHDDDATRFRTGVGRRRRDCVGGAGQPRGRRRGERTVPRDGRRVPVRRFRQLEHDRSDRHALCHVCRQSRRDARAAAGVARGIV